MRILYFTRDYTSHDHRFLSALAKTEHRIYYLRLERGEQQWEDRPLPPEVEQILWRGGKRRVGLKDGAGLLFDLHQIIHQVKPDVIQAGPIQRSALLVALTGFQPLVSMSWGYDLILDARRNGWWRWATRYTLRHSAVLIGDCDTIRQIARSYGMADERIVTFPWGIDLQHFSPPQPETQEATNHTSRPTFTLLSTRSWEPLYGVEIIARAFVQAAKQCEQLRLIMLGNGSQAGLIRKIFTQGGLNDYREGTGRVIFPGLVRYSELPRYYRSANLYVAASHSDGTSISLLEAMACGCPVVVSDIPGNREWVTPEREGWLFPDDDSNALAEAILNAVRQRSRLPEMGQSARQLVEKRADWNKNFLELLRAYDIAQSYS